MEWIAQLQGQVVGLDSAPLIYFIQENPAYLEMTNAFFEAMVRGELRVVTSVITLLEVHYRFSRPTFRLITTFSQYAKTELCSWRYEKAQWSI
jgi:predicted nucleic acid-binding protein